MRVCRLATCVHYASIVPFACYDKLLAIASIFILWIFFKQTLKSSIKWLGTLKKMSYTCTQQLYKAFEPPNHKNIIFFVVFFISLSFWLSEDFGIAHNFIYFSISIWIYQFLYPLKCTKLWSSCGLTMEFMHLKQILCFRSSAKTIEIIFKSYPVRLSSG